MKNPSSLTPDQLSSIVAQIQQILYVDPHDGTVDPDKQWDGADVCQDIAGILAEHGLVPIGLDPQHEALAAEVLRVAGAT